MRRPPPSRRRRTRRRAAFTMIEVLLVVIVIGVMVAILGPKFRINEATEVQLVAMQIAQDLDYGRTRALATRSLVSYVFRPGSGDQTYVGYRDHDDDGLVARVHDETLALRGIGTRTLPARVRFGRGAAPPIPGDGDPGDSDGVTFAGNHVEYSTRGIVEPLGTSGVVYLRHHEKTDKVAAVELEPSGSVRIWTYREGSWQ